jgi:hypothetical protein
MRGRRSTPIQFQHHDSALGPTCGVAGDIVGAVAGAGASGDGSMLNHLADRGISAARGAHARVRKGDDARTDPSAAIVPGQDESFANAAEPAGAAWRAARRLRVAADWIAEHVARGRMADPAIAWAAAAIERAGGAIRVAALRERAGWSKSRFATLFREQVARPSNSGPARGDRAACRGGRRRRGTARMSGERCGSSTTLPRSTMSEANGTGAPVIREAFPYLCVRGAPRAIEFYTRVFGAVEKLRLTDEQGRIGHA